MDYVLWAMMGAVWMYVILLVAGGILGLCRAILKFKRNKVM